MGRAGFDGMVYEKDSDRMCTVYTVHGTALFDLGRDGKVKKLVLPLG